MTDPAGLVALQLMFGGKLYTRKKRNPKHKDNVVWNVHSAKSVAPILTALLPHLRVKREQANAVLSFIAVRSASAMPTGIPDTTTYSHLETSTYALLRRLNRRGRSGDEHAV